MDKIEKYKNISFDNFVNNYKGTNDKILNYINEIYSFYKEINTNIEFTTKKYRDSIYSVLNKFPIIISHIKDENTTWQINNDTINEEELVEILKKYTNLFETLRYLNFLREENRNVVFVGPNGSGKTSLIRKLKNDTKDSSIYYFSADRLLLTSSHFTPNRDYKTFIDNKKKNYASAIDINNQLKGGAISNQFDYSICLLENERNDENEKGIKSGKTQKIIDEWNYLVKDRQLYFDHGLHVKTLDGDSYSLNYLSTGEKEILFFLIEAILLDESNYYFVDEPENNLNPAIVDKLWNFIEKQRPNSIFVYLTHDSEFVASRINAKIYWIESFDGKKWKWNELKENSNIPQELLVKLVGCREPIIFCESHDEYKYDSQLYKLLFPKYKIVSVSGCDKVCMLTKAYKEIGLPQKAFGIIDRDYRSDEEVEILKEKDIYCIPFFEIENLLFSDNILSAMIEQYSITENKNEVINEVEDKIIKKFINSKEEWVAKHVAYEIRNKFDYNGKIKSITNLNDLKILYNEERLQENEIDCIAKRYYEHFEQIVNKNEYNTVLRYLDHKSILSLYNKDLHFPEGLLYEKEVLNFLNSDKNQNLLEDIREYLDFKL